MGLPRFSVMRPVSILMIFVALIVLGFISLSKLPVELMPNTAFNRITIYVGVRGGMPPEEVEKLVTRPIEEAVGTVSKLKSMRSVSKKERSEVVLQFEPGTNMDFASLEIREKFARVKYKLPKDIEKPIIASFEETDRPVITLSVESSEISLAELKNLLDAKVKDKILRIDGVANVKTSGGGSDMRKIYIESSLSKLQNYGISENAITQAIGRSNNSFAVGYVEQQGHRLMFRAMGEYTSLDEIGETIIKTDDKENAVIRIKDVAKIFDSSVEAESLVRVNGKSVVSVSVQRESTANTVQVVEDARKVIMEFKEKYHDKGIIIEEKSNQADFIKEAIGSVKGSLLIGGVLSMIILFLFLRNFRSTMAVALSIPISVIMTFTCMYFQKLTINVMTLSGLALGIGMLIDNSVVVLENIHRVGKEGCGKVAGAIKGTEEMILAIVSSTLTTVIVFLPIVFVSKEIQLLYSGLSMTVTYSLFASLFVALTLVPCYSALVMKNKNDPSTIKPKKLKNFPIKEKLVAIVTERRMLFEKAKNTKAYHVLCSIGARIKKFKGRLPLYKKLIIVTLRYRYICFAVVTLIFVLSIFLFNRLDKTLMGTTDEGNFTIYAELDSGAKLEISNQIVGEIEDVLKDIPEVKDYSSEIEPTSSRIYVMLVPLKERKRSTQEIIDELRIKTDDIETNYKKGFIHYSEQQSAGGGKEIEINIFGHNYDILKEIAISIASRISAIEGIEDPKMARLQGRPELRLIVDKIKAAYMGYSTGSIAKIVHGQMRGYRASTVSSNIQGLKVGGQEIEIVTRLAAEDRDSFDAIGRLSLVNSDSLQEEAEKPVFLNQLVDYSVGIGPSEIFRRNKSRTFHVSANIGENPLGKIVEKIKEALGDLKLPKEYYYEYGEEYKKMLKNQKELTLAALITLVLVYMVLASLFESYYQPFIIMSSVCLAAIGAILMLYLCKISVSMGVMIGAIMLFGIVVNNGIVMVDHINHLRKRNSGALMPSVIQGAANRLRPVMMTSLTTILGMVPMAMDRGSGAALWSPLAITVIGGMISATFLTLFVVPCVYVIFEDITVGLKKLAAWVKVMFLPRKYLVETDVG